MIITFYRQGPGSRLKALKERPALAQETLSYLVGETARAMLESWKPCMVKVSPQSKATSGVIPQELSAVRTQSAEYEI